jgi:short-subunit dehydrogenase
MNILVTGGSGGLGKQIVNDLLCYNHTIYYTYNQNEVSFDNLNVKSFKVDFTNLLELDDFLFQIRDLQIDVLINNYFNKIEKKHAHKLNRIEILEGTRNNIVPTIAITNCVIASMRKNKKGKIINILTDYLKSSAPTGLSKYVAEKVYLEAFMRSLQTENSNFNIDVHFIYPKIMFTKFAEIDTVQKENIIASLIAH